MKYLLRQLELPMDYKIAMVNNVAAQRLGCKTTDILSCEVIRRSLDARPWRNAPVFIISAEVTLNKQLKTKKLPPNTEIVKDENTGLASDFLPTRIPTKRPVVVGAGPAGLMAAITLARAGAKPILLERGSKAEERHEIVSDFWENGKLILENNVLYGEGGAGLFSDGKLTARSKDHRRIKSFFNDLVKAGASSSILIDAEPHLGSDALLKIIPGLRNEIQANGGEIFYNTALTEINTNNGKITSIKAGDMTIETDDVILATGHSARDIYRLLAEINADLEAKPMAIGIRLEIPQKQINKSQFRKFADDPRMHAASYRLTRKSEDGVRACYTFCMCPGGQVIACANEENGLTTNGMSLSKRNEAYGNAAFIVPIEPDDYNTIPNKEKHSVLAGISYQRSIEEKAFIAGGSDYTVPALMLKDFLKGKISGKLPSKRSCQRSKPASFDTILPEYVLNTLRHQIPHMLKELNEANPDDAVVYAAETRSSSPVRVLRNDNGQSPSIKGLYPAGEGAGYAGGIVSSAVDGIKAAEMVLTDQK